MNALLALSRLIDRINERIGRTVMWLVLVAVAVSAVNAIVRKVFNMSSNAFLEAQWYMFSAIFLLCAAYTLQRNEHIRIDVVAGKLSKRAQTWIDILGTIFFLTPMALLIMVLSWKVFTMSYISNEVSTNAGGLPIWPARALVPVGFFLLLLQGLSELIKRFAFLKGLIPDPTEKVLSKSAEAELAEAIRQARGEVA